MEKALDVFRNELKGLRTGRATPALLDTVRVDYYGSPTPVKQIANISTPDPQSILIKPFNVADLKEIEKAIRSTDLGLSPNNDGKAIRLSIPSMSGDRRNKMVKKVKELGEAAKVACRNIRRDGNKHFEVAEKDATLSEDDAAKGKDDVQGMLKSHESKIDELSAAKTKEIMEV